MATYYILTQAGDVFEMDATTEAITTLSGEVTEHPVESGEVVADHYVHSPVTISLSGVITDTKSLRGENTKTTKDYLDGLLRVYRAKQTFIVYSTSNLEPWDNCVFTSLEITQNTNRGVVDGYSSYVINLSAKQVKYVEAATIALGRDQDPEFRDLFSSLAASSGTTQEVPEGGIEAEAFEKRTVEAEIADTWKMIEDISPFGGK